MNLLTKIKQWVSKPKFIFLEDTTNNGARWTNDEIDAMIDMYAEGLTDEEISIALGRSVSAVHQKRLKSTKN